VVSISLQSCFLFRSIAPQGHDYLLVLFFEDAIDHQLCIPILLRELSISNCGSYCKLTLKTLGTVTVSLVDSPLAEMTVTVGLDIVALVLL
jgi:hypothetical protein